MASALLKSVLLYLLFFDVPLFMKQYLFKGICLVSRQHCEILTIVQQGTLHLEYDVKFTDCTQRIQSMFNTKIPLKVNLSFR